MKTLITYLALTICIYANAEADAAFVTNNINVSSETKIALVLTPTTIKCFVNGAQFGSTYNVITPIADLEIFTKNSEAKVQDKFKSIIFFNTAITDAEAECLTS